jgi:hypothetical protein
MQLIEDLNRTEAQTLTYFDLPELELNKAYAPGKWTIRELLNHIVDAETVLYDRIRRIISEQPRPVIWAFQQDNWCQHLDYKSFPLEINKSIFIATRKAIKYLAANFYEEKGANDFIHSETGLRTLKDEMDKVVWHCDHHLVQIELAIKNG